MTKLRNANLMLWLGIVGLAMLAGAEIYSLVDERRMLPAPFHSTLFPILAVAIGLGIARRWIVQLGQRESIERRLTVVRGTDKNGTE